MMSGASQKRAGLRPAAKRFEGVVAMGDLIGRRLGDFEVVRELGRGGMGVVYEARQVSLNRKVALKMLGPGLGLTAKAVPRFRREAEAAAKLHHSNIVPVYATGEQDGTHFYAMELIDGPSLDLVIRHMRGGPDGDTRTGPPADAAPTGPYVPADLTPPPSGSPGGSGAGSSAERFDRAAAMIADVAEALQHAHQQGVTHRDIKPSNLLLSSDGRLSVTDFGLARVLEQPGMTVTGEFLGTPAYMSPEQFTAGHVPVDHRTDIYSLGATLYELLTLRPPFRADGRDKLLAMVTQKEPGPPRTIDPKVPRDLETICLKCLAKDPDRRYQTAQELADDLRRYLNRFAILAKRAGPLARAKKWVKRNPALSAATLALLVALAAAVFFAWRTHEADLRRQEEVTAEKRQAAMDRAILAAISSQFAEADAALLEAEQLGADLAERRFVAGILSHYRGDSEAAKRQLLEACGERPDWVAPRAFLAFVCVNLHDFAGQAEHGNAALKLTPVTAEDYLFRGLMVGTINPRRGLPDLGEAWRRRRSVLAQFTRAEVLSVLADDTGRVEDAAPARDAFRGARAFLGDAPLVSRTGLYIHCIGCNNCRLHGRTEEAKQWLAEGADEFRIASAGAWRTHPEVLAARSIYLALQDGSAEALAAENRDMGRRGPQTEACHVYLASLLRRGKTDDALAYLRGFPDPGPNDLRRWDELTFERAVFLVGRDRDAARAECRRAVAEAARSAERWYLVEALSLVGLPEEARQQADEFQWAPPLEPEWQELHPFGRRVFAHAYEGPPLGVEAEIAGSRMKRVIASDILGFAALGRGDRDEARAWFRKADEHPPVSFSTYLWMRAVRARLLADHPVWPPWLAEKK
jgi:serine/threonine protein kinase